MLHSRLPQSVIYENLQFEIINFYKILTLDCEYL